MTIHREEIRKLRKKAIKLIDEELLKDSLGLSNHLKSYLNQLHEWYINEMYNENNHK
jgi:hypothetical protein